MNDYSFIDSKLLKKAYFSELRPEEICWKPKDIKNGINDLTEKDKKIGAITIYFKVDDKVYCPMWGDCLILESGNDNYLKLLDGIELDKDVNYEMIYQLIGRFALAVPKDYDWSKDKANFKSNVPRELAKYDLNEMYFCLNIK
ncbi:hypothetical protein [Pontibacter sp. BAB1700]|uniref:hypothetical protein n=1 Tax=Pontibacter sp. BAB1700 TaxID=1144253 RepID=UPI0002ED600C|nr:hypothetical protein [Pontibacter sp. BAB1700]